MLLFYLISSDEPQVSKKEKREIEKREKKEKKIQFFEMLYWKYSGYVLNFVYSRCKDSVLAQDTFQETWLSVLTHIDKLDGKNDTDIESFIIKTADNRIKNSLSQRRKERQHTVYELSEDIEDETDLFAQCESQEVELVIQCIEMLKEEQRDVLSLYYLYDFSLKEIAKHLNLSETAVNSRLCRGRNKLIQLLKERGLE